MDTEPFFLFSVVESGKKIQNKVECEAFVQIDSPNQPKLKFIRRNQIRQRLAIKISFMLIFIVSAGHM